MELDPDLINELLFIDMEDDEVAVVSGGRATPVEVQLRDVRALVAGAKEGVTLTAKGEMTIKSWMAEFSTTRNPEAIVRHYPDICCEASSFFCGLSQFTAAKVILDIIHEIIAETKVDESCSSAEITFFENDILEYLAGYAIRKAASKYPQPSVINALCADHPRGSFIPLMERKAGKLLYPAENFMLFAQHIYLKFSVEASKNPNKISFNMVTQDVIYGTFFNSFVGTIATIAEADDDTVKMVMTYIADLLVRMLSYTFAKKLLSRLQAGSSKFSAGLRGDLKRQMTK